MLLSRVDSWPSPQTLDLAEKAPVPSYVIFLLMSGLYFITFYKGVLMTRHYRILLSLLLPVQKARFVMIS